MKQYPAAALALALALILVSCDVYAKEGGASSSGGSSAPERSSASQPEDADHSHQPAQESNIVPHDMPGYCGNTITTISSGSLAEGEDWVASFWGDDSVALTDLLRYLDYSGDMCKCLPEYSVKTEFSEEAYGVSLSGGYARHDGGQAELTQEQIELIQGILDRNLPGPQRDRST